MHIYVSIYSTSLDECLLCVRQVLEAENIGPSKMNAIPASMEFLF